MNVLSHSHRIHRPGATAAAAALCLLGAAQAQDAPARADGSTTRLDQVTVTSTKRAMLLTDVPQSVQALGAEKLAAEGVQSVSDLVQIVPGASQTFKAAPGFEVLQVRGVSSGSLGDALVGYYIDEIPFSLPNTQFIPPVDVSDVQRVEVLRGPQGTLYGQSSMGGAIKLITKRPDLRRFGGELTLGYDQVQGGHEGEKVGAVLNVPLKTDVAALRISAGGDRQQSFIADGGTQRNHHLRVKGLLQASSDLSVEATVWDIHSKQDDYAYGQPTQPYTGITDPKEPRGVATDVTLGNVTVAYASPIGDITSATSYFDHEFDYTFSLPGLRDLLPGAGGWLSQNAVKTRSFSQELRINSNGDGPIDWIGGVFYQDAKISTAQTQGWANYAALGLGPTVWTEGGSRLGTRSYSLFGEISGKLMDGRLVPTLGARLYRDERSSDGLRDGVADSATRSYRSFNPRFNLAFTPAKGQMLYLNVAKGFRSGALQDKASVTAATAAGLPAEELMPQDSLWSYEAGFKWEPVRSVQLELAAYRIDWKNAQITNLIVGANNVTTTVITNGTDVKGTGLDFGLNWATPIDGLVATIAGNVNSTEFTRVPAGTVIQVGDQIPGSPRTSANVGLNYRGEARGLRVFGNVSMNFRARQREMTTGKDSDSIHDLRARIGVGGKQWDASLYGTNLTNQRGVAAVLSTIAVNPIQPRKLGIDVSYKF